MLVIETQAEVSLSNIPPAVYFLPQLVVMSQSDWQFVVVDKNTDSAARVNVHRKNRFYLSYVRYEYRPR